MDIGLYGNYDDDGQISMFDMGAFEDGTPPKSPEQKGGEVPKETAEGEADVRIRRCSSCGKLLFVREEGTDYVSECNNCGVRYLQKK